MWVCEQWMNKTSMWRVNNKRTHLILPAVPYVNQQFTDIYIPYNIRTLTTTVCVYTLERKYMNWTSWLLFTSRRGCDTFSRGKTADQARTKTWKVTLSSIKKKNWRIYSMVKFNLTVDRSYWWIIIEKIVIN